jgi:hypothetical protein
MKEKIALKKCKALRIIGLLGMLMIKIIIPVF